MAVFFRFSITNEGLMRTENCRCKGGSIAYKKVISYLSLKVWVAEEGRDQNRICYNELDIHEMMRRGSIASKNH